MGKELELHSRSVSGSEDALRVVHGKYSDSLTDRLKRNVRIGKKTKKFESAYSAMQHRLVVPLEGRIMADRQRI